MKQYCTHTNDLENILHFSTPKQFTVIFLLLTLETVRLISSTSPNASAKSFEKDGNISEALFSKNLENNSILNL